MGGGASGAIQQVLRTKLEQIIAANQLQNFYPPQALQGVLNRLNSVDFRCGLDIRQDSGVRPVWPSGSSLWV